MKKVYIAGKITDCDNYIKKFMDAEFKLSEKDFIVMNPAKLSMNYGFEHSDYMHVCYAMIEVCDYVYFLNNWKDSVGAMLEFDFALKNYKFIFFEKEEDECLIKEFCSG